MFDRLSLHGSLHFQGSGNLRLAVKLPDGEDTNEWLAVHGVHNESFASHQDK